MRIISQDGAFDVPYENADLERKGTIISVWTLDNVYGSFARYSTEEKAIKAMEMCRKQYMDGEYNRNSLSGVAESIGRLSEGLASVFKEGVCQTFVFKFPEDEEVQEYGK